MPIKPGQLPDQGTLDLNNRDAEGGGMQDHLLEGISALRHHQKSDRLSAGGKGLLNGPTPSDDFVLWADHARDLQGDRPS
jgi:hypothetical protein